MILDRVTLTGADDSINPVELFKLADEFPFVEWGILASFSRGRDGGSPRYPSAAWIDDLQKLQRRARTPLNLALHVQGKWVRDLLIGKITIPAGLLVGFQRIQLNFHNGPDGWESEPFVNALGTFGHRQIIFQLDGMMGHVRFDDTRTVPGDRYKRVMRRVRDGLDLVPLFDTSGGAGVVPDKWPRADWVDNEGEQIYHGYAGGLGPHNVADQLERIHAVAANATIWIDMETRLRSPFNGQDVFDPLKCRAVLEIAKEYINAKAVAAPAG